MKLVFLTKNDHEHYLPELELFHRQHKELNSVFLIQDGGASHIAAGTQSYFAKSRGWWKPRYMPANASWLNQAEILIHAFKHYYLKRASWKSREEFRPTFRLPGHNTIIGMPTPLNDMDESEDASMVR